jgi:hypothetical protein
LPAGFTQREYPALTNDTRLIIGDIAWPFGTTSASKDGVAGVATVNKQAGGYALAEAGPIFKAIAVGA